MTFLHAGAKEAVTCSGEDEGGRAVMNGGNRDLISPSISQAQDNLQTSSCSETANGTINNDKEQASQQVEN